MAGPQSASAAENSCSVTLKPGASIADEVNEQQPGATVCLTSGTFAVPETIAPKDNQTIRGTTGTVLSGAIPLDSWTSRNSLYRTTGVLPAPYDANGQCETEGSNLCNQAEFVMANGKALKPVGSLDKVEEGTYFADYGANAVYVATPPSASMRYTMANTRTALSSTASGVTVENVTVRDFASLPQQGALVVSGPEWTVRNSTVTNNHAIGIMIAQGDNAVIAGNQIVANGQLGLGQWRSEHSLIEGNTIADNNTRGFWVADWESGGMKFTWSSAKIVRNTFADNLGVGIWADVAADDVVISENTISGNSADGIRYEISRNGTITGNTVIGNGLGLKRGGGTGLMSGAGINVNTSSNVRIEDNTVLDNLNGVSVQLRPRGDGPWGAYRLQDVAVVGNRIDMSQPGSPDTAATGVVRASSYDGTIAAAGVSFRDNEYWVSDVDSQRFVLDNQQLTFGEWQAAGSDVGGALSVGQIPEPTLPEPTLPEPTPPAPTPGPVEPQPLVLAADEFTGASLGLGEADTGGAWTMEGGDSYYSTSDGAGSWLMKRPGYAPGAHLRDVSAASAETTVSFALDQDATGSGVYVSLAGRAIEGVGEYRGKVRMSPAGVWLSLVRSDSSGREHFLTEETLIPDAQAVAGRPLTLKLSVSGTSPTRISAKAWVTGDSEPAAWMLSTNDDEPSLQVPGGVGLLASLSSTADDFPVRLRVHSWSTVDVS
ncbi:hypothetical protein GCM10027403_03410 [Arthrobacter tecti]